MTPGRYEVYQFTPEGLQVLYITDDRDKANKLCTRAWQLKGVRLYTEDTLHPYNEHFICQKATACCECIQCMKRAKKASEHFRYKVARYDPSSSHQRR